jgi:hypothetical protein
MKKAAGRDKVGESGSRAAEGGGDDWCARVAGRVAWLDLQGQQSKPKSQTNQEIKINNNNKNNKNK